MNTQVIYHANCKDGLAAAFVAHCCLLEMDRAYNAFPMNYDEVDKIYDIPMSEEDEIFILDFSLPNEMVLELCTKVSKVIILDHHKSAIEKLSKLPKLTNLEMVLDNDRSGAIITFEYFEEMNFNPLEKEFFYYIQDRDLWQWKLEHSKEVSAYLALKVEDNNIDSMANAYWKFQDEKEQLITIGKTCIEMINKQVSKKVTQCIDLELCGVNFKCINATENISELGNAICNTYNQPALMYFIKDYSKLVLSFRSLNNLADVSKVAEQFGGGGHYSASGATTTINIFESILSKNRLKVEKTNG